jgi:hypothetical protein
VETLTSNTVTHEASAGTAELARFFPEVQRVQIRVVLKPRQTAGSASRETVTVEFVSATHAIFVSALPLEFDDLVQLQPAEGKSRTEARVMAVQYHLGRKAVAVQFVNAETSWVNRP